MDTDGAIKVLLPRAQAHGNGVALRHLAGVGTEYMEAYHTVVL